MKSILKFIHVLLGVILFLAIGYGIQTLPDSDLFNDDSVSTVSDTPDSNEQLSHETESIDDILNSDHKNDSNNNTSESEDGHNDLDETTVNHSTDDTNAGSDEPSSTDADAVDSNIVDNEEVDEKPVFNYEMEAIDHHTVDHLDDMIDIIKEYLSEPNVDFSELYRLLYTRNYMHFEKELSEKNIVIHNFMIESLNKIKDADETMVESITFDLIIIEEILINLRNLD